MYKDKNSDRTIAKTSTTIKAVSEDPYFSSSGDDKIDLHDVALIAEVGHIVSRVRNLEIALWGKSLDSVILANPYGAPSTFREFIIENEKERRRNPSASDIICSSGLGNRSRSTGDQLNRTEQNQVEENASAVVGGGSNASYFLQRKKLLEDFFIKFYEVHQKRRGSDGCSGFSVDGRGGFGSVEKSHHLQKRDTIMNSESSTVTTTTTTTKTTTTKRGSHQDEPYNEDDLSAEQPNNLSSSCSKLSAASDQNSQSKNSRIELSQGCSSSNIQALSALSMGGTDSGIESAGAGSTTANSTAKTFFDSESSGGDASGTGDGANAVARNDAQRNVLVVGDEETAAVSDDTDHATGSIDATEQSLLQLKNTIIHCQFNEEDLRAILKDLKQKIEYTERMNWLSGISAGLSKRPMGPPHRKSSLPKHTEVKKHFLEICDKTLSDEVKAALRLPAFDSYEWEDADVIHLMQTMFTELGLIDKFQIPIGTLREWLYEVYKHYNQVPFHNFRHCFCVAQMMYAISRQANLIARLGELEVLILLVSCICHDLDHPGYNNIYQINARTELALRYNDISPLENHHCSIAFRLLEHPECNIFKNFSREQFNEIREGIIRCILATDMARHNEILTQFKDIISVFDWLNRAHINLLCMVLIKVADISNEARPMDVAEPWLDRLLQEFFAQSAAEKSEGLPVTPFMDPDKVSKPGSQVRFIGLVLLPLFEALGELLPDLTELIIIPVRVALDYYKRLNDAQTKSRKSIAEGNENSSDGGGSSSPQLPRSQSGISVRSRRSIPSQKSASRTSVDEPTCIAAELHDLPEGSESGDSETATEVDVAEKTSKFKVDTEGNQRQKVSHSTSRKSSREKRPSMISEMCSSGGRMRNSYGNIHGYHSSNRGNFGSNRAVSLDQYSNNRRSSDCLQQVISDSNVFYNRNNQSQEHEGKDAHAGDNLNTSSTEIPKREPNASGFDGEDVLNMNMSPGPYYNPNREKRKSTDPTNKIVTNNSGKSDIGDHCAQNPITKTWRARFRQITEIFSFSFEKNAKRYGSARSSSVRNNNSSDLQKPLQGHHCCTTTTSGTLSNNVSPHLKHKHQDLINAGRNRAYSLDVPCTRHRCSSSSGGGDSRKSSRNEENSNRNDLLTEDNNSNHTSSGEALPPPLITIGGDVSVGLDAAVDVPGGRQQKSASLCGSIAGSQRLSFTGSGIGPAGGGGGKAAGGVDCEGGPLLQNKI